MVYAVGAHGFFSDDEYDPSKPLRYASQYGKRTWQARTCEDLGECPGGIFEAVELGYTIHCLLSSANISAYIWSDGVAPLAAFNIFALVCKGNIPHKFMYVLGNYSRFVRPGYFRIDAEGSTANIHATAFKDLSTGKFVIVVINTDSTAADVDVNFNDFIADTVTPWITSDQKNLEKGEVIQAGSSFTATVAGLSATSFCGVGPASTISNRHLSLSNTTQQPSIRMAGNNLIIPQRFKGHPLRVNIYFANGRHVNSFFVPGMYNQTIIPLQRISNGLFIVEMSCCGEVLSDVVVMRE
jgi:hypothetical protein